MPVTPVPVRTQEQRAIAALVLCCERLGMGRISALGQRAPKKLVYLVTLALSCGYAVEHGARFVK